MKNGVVYAVVGKYRDRYLRETLESLASLRLKSPGIPVYLATDKPERILNRAFDKVLTIEAPREALIVGVKIDALRASPFDRTMFLDSDTHICADITSMFDILDVCDVAAALAPRRTDPWTPPEPAPEWFPERNSGMLLVRRSQSAAAFLEDWRALYYKYGKWNDQLALRVALYRAVHKKLRLYNLPPEYNCRVMCLTGLAQPVRIIHGREPDMPCVCRRINAHTGVRVYIPGHGIFVKKDWKYVGGG